MKAIRMRIQKSSRPLVILLATVVAIITSIVVANATQTITTPNAAVVSYNLAPGKDSATITPATNRPVLVMGCCTTTGFRLVGQVSLLHIQSTAITWFGFESESPATITRGDTSSPGAHILYLDALTGVDIQVNSADTIKIHNHNQYTTFAGTVTLIW